MDTIHYGQPLLHLQIFPTIVSAIRIGKGVLPGITAPEGAGPFLYIPQHMATAVPVDAFWIRDDRHRTQSAVMAPAVLPHITPGIAPTFWTAGRFLPLGLCGQAIMPPRLPAQPVAVRLGIMPADAHHWMIALVRGRLA